MSGTKAGAAKAVRTIRDRYGDDWYIKLGATGGSVSSPTKGMGYEERNWWQRLLRKPTRAQRLGAIGGRKSKRRKVLTNEV